MTYQKGQRGYWLGKKKPHSQKTKDKIREALIGHPVSEKVRRAEKSPFKHGHIPWNKGLPWSDEMKKRISQTNKGRGIKPKSRDSFKFGAGHPRWKGGVTPLNEKIRKSLEYRLWRKSVFKRDNYTCRFCGKTGGELNADHIKSFAYFPELRFAIDNGRTLCKPCHQITDNYGGKNKR